MKLLLKIILVFYSLSVFAQSSEVEKLHSDSKIQLMYFGSGVISGMEVSAVISKCGTFKSDSATKGVMALICKTLPGVQTVKIEKGAEQLLYKLIVTKPNFQTPLGSLNTITEESIKSALGEPYKISGNVLDYSVPSYENPNTILFTIVNGNVSKIEWQWSTD